MGVSIFKRRRDNEKFEPYKYELIGRKSQSKKDIWKGEWNGRYAVRFSMD